jgi:hypothetical protein
LKSKHGWEDNIIMNLKAAVCEDVNSLASSMLARPSKWEKYKKKCFIF